ncbi:putative variant surface glycoprotein, (VSG) [Trypanosoma vivax]|nr:putative variant surface glycoprotein, (VSG) [Trypanosoma vivax]
MEHRPPHVVLTPWRRWFATTYRSHCSLRFVKEQCFAAIAYVRYFSPSFICPSAAFSFSTSPAIEHKVSLFTLSPDMRTALLRTTLVGVLLAATLSGTAPDIFARCAAEGRPGSALLVEGGAQLICDLSGALKKVGQYAEKYHRTHGFSCTGPVAEQVKDKASKLASKIDTFVSIFESGYYGSASCLVNGNTPWNSARTVKDNESLKGCHHNGNSIRSVESHGSVMEELESSISRFTAVIGGESWKSGVSSVFRNTRGNECPLTLHEASMNTHCAGKLNQYGSTYGGLWKIKGEHYEMCNLYECTCSDYYSYAHPKIYWIGDGDSYDAEMLRTLREDLKTLNEGGESKCANLHTALSTHTQTQLHENNDKDNSRVDRRDGVHGNGDNVETEQQAGGSSGSTDTNATVVSENYGDSRARSEPSSLNSRNNDSNSMRASTDDNASTAPAQNSPLYTDIHISSSCRLGGVIFVFAGVFFGKTFILFPMR